MVFGMLNSRARRPFCVVISIDPPFPLGQKSCRKLISSSGALSKIRSYVVSVLFNHLITSSLALDSLRWGMSNE